MIRIGFPCVHTELPSSSKTFRLNNYSPERFRETVASNLAALKGLLQYCIANGFGFFRISSDLLPFGGHPIQSVDWKREFKKDIEELGEIARHGDLRLSFHPGQFVVLNSMNPQTVANSIADLDWHSCFFDIMGMDSTAKVQIHVGGAFGDKDAALQRFAACYHTLPLHIQRRLVIENDDKVFSLADCLKLRKLLNNDIPIIFDNLHHECLNNGESLEESIRIAASTWKPERDGRPMMDYSEQCGDKQRRIGTHAVSISQAAFREYCRVVKKVGADVDVMLEVKDKQQSGLVALGVLQSVANECTKKQNKTPPPPITTTTTTTTTKPNKRARRK